MTIKTYSRKKSAEALLRKLGVKAADHGQFIKTLKSGRFSVNVGRALDHLASSSKAGPKAAKQRVTITSTIRDLVLAGKTNEEIFKVVQKRFDLDESKAYYPGWYRSYMKRKGML